MKDLRFKIILLLAIVVVAIVGAFLIGTLLGNPPRDVALGFVGLTNTGTRTEALFVLSNHPGNLWIGVTGVSRNTADGWVAETGFFNLNFHGSLLGIPINTTNEPSRTVVLIRLPSMADRVKHTIEETFHVGNASTFSGRSYSITNEIPVVKD